MHGCCVFVCSEHGVSEIIVTRSTGSLPDAAAACI
jgi:hypothetical protein